MAAVGQARPEPNADTATRPFEGLEPPRDRPPPPFGTRCFKLTAILSFPLLNLVSDSATPHHVSDPLPHDRGIIVALDSSGAGSREVISSTVK